MLIKLILAIVCFLKFNKNLNAIRNQCKVIICFLWHTYIHNYPLQSFKSGDYSSFLVSHTTYVVCVNFIHKWQDLQFKVDSERQIWETVPWQFYLLSEFLPEICWEEIAEEILFVFRFDVWPGTGTLAFRLISQYTIY